MVKAKRRDYQLVIFDRKREVARFLMESAEEAVWLGGIVTRGTHWLFAVQSPLPGLDTAPGSFLKVS